MKLIIFLIALIAVGFAIFQFGLVSTAAVLVIGWVLLEFAELLYEARS